MQEKGRRNLKNATVVKAIFSVTGILILGKLTGFLKQIFTAGLFGTTIETDVILLSQTFIGDIQYLLVQVILTAFTATYIHALERGKNEAERFAGDIVKVFTLIAVVLTIGTVVLSPWIAAIIAPSYDAELSAQLAAYMRIYAPALLCFVWTAIAQALLNANRRFALGETTTVNQNVLYSVAVLLLAGVMGPKAMVVAFYAHTIYNVLFLAYFARPYCIFTGRKPFKNPEVRSMLHMMGPLFLGYAMVYVNQQVDKILVSGLEEGTVSALMYGGTLYSLVSTFICSFASILFTYITAKISKKEHKQAAELAIMGTNLMTIAVIPLSIVFVLCAEDIVDVVFGHGAFDSNAVKKASEALRGYAFAFVPLVYREVFSRFQYGYQNTMWPSISSTVGIIGNIVLSLALCPILGVFGVTIATTGAIVISGGMNAFFAYRHNNRLRFREVARQLPLQVCAGCLCVLVILWGQTHWKETGSLMRLILTGGSAVMAYTVIVSPVLLRLWKKRAVFET